MAAEALGPLAVVAAVAVAARAVVWTEWDGRDIHVYATIARFWRDGLIPYRDLYDFKPPLTYVILLLGSPFADFTPDAFRRVVLVFAAIGALLMYGGLRRSGQLVAAPVSALGFLTLLCADPSRTVSQNTELLTAVFGAAAFGCAAAHERGGWGWAFGSGAALGLATLSKQPAALWAIPLALQLYLGVDAPASARRRWRKAAPLVPFACGGALVVGACLLYFAVHGAAGALLEAVVVDGGRYAKLWVPITNILTRPTTRLIGGFLKTPELWPFVGSIALLVPLTLVRRSRSLGIAWAWLLSSYVVVVMGPRDEHHYIIAAFPAVAIVIGVVFEQLLPRPDAIDARYARRRLVGAVLLCVLMYGQLWRTQVFPKLNDDSQPGPELAAARNVGARIAALAQPGDTLFVRDEPFLTYLYAGVPPPTRCIYGDSPNRQVNALCVDSMQRKPTFVAVGYDTEAKMWTDQGGKEADLAHILERDYDVAVADCPYAVIYQRRQRGAPMSLADGSGGPAVGWPLPVDEAGRLPLTSLEPLKVEFGFSPPKLDRSWDDHDIVLDGKKYANGIGVHAWARMTWAVPEGAVAFEAVIGMTDSARRCGTPAVTFEVTDDHRNLLFDSGLITPQIAAQRIRFDLGTAKTVTLSVGEGSNGRDCDHAAWGDPVFLLRP